MSQKKDSQSVDHLTFLLANQLFALPYHSLVQIIDAPEVTRLPDADKTVRGTINFQGESVVLYDLRSSLGISTLADEIHETNQQLAQRKQDHINWLNKLKDEVYHEREISVQTDPHQCAFGKWYDTFRPESTVLADYMARFDTPHKRIHRLAVQAKELLNAGKKDAARDLIHAAEQRELTTLLALFDSAEQTIRTFTYEYAVVIENEGAKVAISVDAVRSFDRFDDIVFDIPPLMKRSGAGFVRAIGRRQVGDRTDDVLILDITRILWN